MFNVYSIVQYYIEKKKKKKNQYYAKRTHNTVARLAKSEGWAVWGLEGGLETLTESLVTYLQEKGVEIFTNAETQNISIQGSVTLNVQFRAHRKSKISKVLGIV